MSFARLDNFLELEVEYIAKSALAIHAGKETAFEATEAPVIKVGGKPVIPGSSIKGSLRSTLEAFLAGESISVCLPLSAIPNSVRKEDHEKYVKEIGRKMPCTVDKPCPICQIFGTAAGKQGLSGSTIFADAVPVSEVNLIERTHVALTRDTKSQAGGKLMTFQAVDAGAKFRGTIRVINSVEWQIGALLQAIETLQSLGMGSKKTAGYGELTIKAIEIRKKIHKNGIWETQSADNYKEIFLKAFTNALVKMERFSPKQS